MTADIFYMPTPRTDLPELPGYYVEADLAMKERAQPRLLEPEASCGAIGRPTR